MSSRKKPLWLAVLIVALMLPVIFLPAMLPPQPEDSVMSTLMWFYPLYAIASGYLAWHCYDERPYMTWILLGVLLLSHASVFALTLIP
ncbi:MAG: hypothetical protein HUK14_05645 [Muribaculaceae bacterium]|nr:hypothetical protein [Muribaculaceae bacterium]